MQGVIEATAKESRRGGILHGLVEIAGVITDDVLGETGDYPVLPTTGQNWIHPLDLTDHQGRRIADVTVNFPSLFRKLPLADLRGRQQAKERFELLILQHMQATGANVVVSDHYMARIEHLVNGFGLFGQVLNIHPAITIPGHPHAYPGKTPTADAIAKARKCGSAMTGATLHFMDTIIDHGPAIAYQCATAIEPTDESHHLRARNYPLKCHVFVAGIRHYIQHLFPYLDRLNFRNFTQRAWLGRK